MSNTGARAFFLMLDTIKDTLLEDKNITSVTYGDLTDVDLSKQTIFPLGHIIVNSAQNDGQTMSRFFINFLETFLCKQNEGHMRWKNLVTLTN